MYQAAEEIQVEPDFAIYQNSHSGNEDSQLDYLEETDGIQLCNQPWVDYDENAFDITEEPYEVQDQNEFISVEALKVPDENNESCDDAGAESSSQSQEHEKKRKLSNVIVLDSDNDDDDEDIDQINENSPKRGKYTENAESDDDVILIEDDENDTGYLRNNSSFLTENNRGVSYGYYNDVNTATRTESGAYECSVCGKRVASSYNLKRHMMIHTGERPFGCDICDKRFREFSDLKKHRRIHSSDPAYKCMVCLINTPSPMNPTKCYSCDQIRVQGPPPSSLVTNNSGFVMQTPSLVNNTTTVNNTTITMVKSTQPTSDINSTSRNFATKRTSNSSNLDRRFSSVSPAPMASSITNEIFAEHFQYTEDGVNKKGYSCPICDRIFGSRHNLKRHFMIHTGEKPYSCDVCDRSFREFSTLKKHTLTHMRGKFYNCEICGEEFNNYGSYTAHTLKHSTNSNHFNYNDVDPLGNTSELILSNAAVNLDTNALLYKNNIFQCFSCNKTFREQEKLNAHLVVHKNDINKFTNVTKIEDGQSITVNNSVVDC